MTSPALQQASDEHLAGLVASRNTEAFSILVQRHTTRFYRVAYSVVMHQQDAEDMVQEAFIKLWHGKATWDANKNAAFTTWFYRIVYHQALDHLRKKPPFYAITQDIVERSPNAETRMVKNQQAEALTQALLDLPERQRSALLLVYKEGLKQRDAAEIMDIGVRALESLLSRGKQALRERMKAK